MLVVSNPSPFHISFIGVTAKSAGQSVEVNEPTMVAPMSSQRYPLPGFKGTTGEVVFSAINDYGGYSEPQTVPLNR